MLFHLLRTKGYEIHITSSVADKLLYTVRVKVRTPILQTPYYRIDLPLQILSSFYILTVTMLQFYKFNPKIKAADLKILINTQDLSLHKIQKLHNLNSLIHSVMPLIPEACIKQSIF